MTGYANFNQISRLASCNRPLTYIPIEIDSFDIQYTNIALRKASSEQTIYYIFIYAYRRVCWTGTDMILTKYQGH